MHKNLPLISVEYPDSESSYLKTRYVRVASMDSVHLKGYEYSTRNPSDSDEGKFKTYLLAKISKGGVSLLEFESEQD